MPELSTLDDLDPDSPMGRCLHDWHRVLQGDREALGELVAENAVLHSPVLFKPLPGRDTVVMYLTAAAMSFVGRSDGGSGGSDGETTVVKHPDGSTDWDGRFRYVREVVGDRDAVLEFETTMAGRYVNGVDMIRCDDDGKIVDFKVMVRPAQAIVSVKELMVAALDTLQPKA